MKKILFSAMALCGFMAGNSQSSVSTATNTLAGPVSAGVNLTLEIRNIIRINSHTPAGLTAVFDQASELDNGLDLTNGSADGAAFSIASNRPFHVDLSASPIVKTLDYFAPGYPFPQTPMTLNVIKWSIQESDPGVFPNIAGWQNLASSVNDILDAYPGASRDFKLKFKADPQWNYEGGMYKTTVTVTATQQ